MKLFSRYITIFAVIVAAATGCALDELGLDPITNENSDAVTVIGRMTRFDERDVLTRGVKNEDEAKLTSMAMAIFKVNQAGDGLDGGCVYYQYAEDQAELLFTIERGSNYDYDACYAMYIFANMPGMASFEAKDDANNIPGSTLEEMMAVYYSVTDINIPQNGFPMMGSLGDTFSTTFDKDGKEFILSPLLNGELTTPKVDGVTQTLLTIPMKAMFAKVNFSIEVRPDQTIDGNYSPQFTLEGYTVNNVPSMVDFNNITNPDSDVLTKSCSLPITGNKVASGANKINFSFYLPERLLTPNYTCSTYPDYPFDKGTYSEQIDADGDGYRDEDEKYFQRFKSKLLGPNQKATNIVLSGTFRDHQNHQWDVDYTIHLGENSDDDFNIRRNCEYNNYVTIRGIQASSDMSSSNTAGSEAISIDHRVNIERSQPAIITLRREVLLDSHFEVRPLRVRKSDVGDVGDINAVKVEVVDPTNTAQWIRLERSAGEGTDYEGKTNASGESIYITADGPSKGKRRYFTYNLVDGQNAGTYDYPLINSHSVILPLTDETECCWIYIDECTEVGDEVRSGIVRVTYGNLDNINGTFTPTTNNAFPAVNYIINQRKLFKVVYDDPETATVENRTYHIEYEEEYLHNYDADDSYGQTEYEGMPWGLDGLQLSYADNAEGDGHFAIIQESGDNFIAQIIDGFMNYFISRLNSFYDFYITKHDSHIMPIVANLHDRNGYEFCKEIIQVANGYGYSVPAAKDEFKIDKLALNENPNSAVEYCYNKNKRNSEGLVVWENSDGTYNQEELNWYLPAIDEMEDIVMSKYSGANFTYSRFKDFQNKFYWSSQPAFNKNWLHYNAAIVWRISADYDYYTDDPNRARATKVIYQTDFREESSSVDGYYQVVHLRGSGSDDVTTYNLPKEFETKNQVSYEYKTGIFDSSTGTKTFVKDQLISRKPGNKSRNESARVRCVRK